MSAQTNQIVPVVSIVNNHPVTTSLNVAEVFGKEHYNVMRDIKSLDVPQEFNALNFEGITYRDARGRIQSAYNMTRDGFTILVMGFTGKKAMQFKLAYIDAFNAMEAKLHGAVCRVEKPSCPSLPYLTDDQAYEIRLLVSTKVRALIGIKSWHRYGYGRIYKAIKERFGVDTYRHVQASEYYSLRAFVASIGSDSIRWDDDTEEAVRHEVLSVMADAEGVFSRARRVMSAPRMISESC